MGPTCEVLFSAKRRNIVFLSRLSDSRFSPDDAGRSVHLIVALPSYDTQPQNCLKTGVHQYTETLDDVLMPPDSLQWSHTAPQLKQSQT